MSTEKHTVAHFTIHGDFITNHFRDRVAEGDWREAHAGLLDSLVGATEEHVAEILAGRKQLVGVNDIEYVDDDASEKPGWDDRQYQTYVQGLAVFGDKIYKRYSVIDGFDSHDLGEAMDKIGLESLPRFVGSEGDGWALYLAAIYAN